MRFDIVSWTLNGRPLAKPHQIARRLVAFPVLLTGKALIFFALMLGWGLDDAVYAWRDLP